MARTKKSVIEKKNSTGNSVSVQASDDSSDEEDILKSRSHKKSYPVATDHSSSSLVESSEEDEDEDEIVAGRSFKNSNPVTPDPGLVESSAEQVSFDFSTFADFRKGKKRPRAGGFITVETAEGRVYLDGEMNIRYIKKRRERQARDQSETWTPHVCIKCWEGFKTDGDLRAHSNHSARCSSALRSDTFRVLSLLHMYLDVNFHTLVQWYPSIIPNVVPESAKIFQSYLNHRHDPLGQPVYKSERNDPTARPPTYDRFDTLSSQSKKEDRIDFTKLIGGKIMSWNGKQTEAFICWLKEVEKRPEIGQYEEVEFVKNRVMAFDSTESGDNDEDDEDVKCHHCSQRFSNKSARDSHLSSQVCSEKTFAKLGIKAILGVIKVKESSNKDNSTIRMMSEFFPGGTTLRKEWESKDTAEFLIVDWLPHYIPIQLLNNYQPVVDYMKRLQILSKKPDFDPKKPFVPVKITQTMIETVKTQFLCNKEKGIVHT